MIEIMKKMSKSKTLDWSKIKVGDLLKDKDGGYYTVMDKNMSENNVHISLLRDKHKASNG